MGNMKANRKFVEGEEAVSAVIGVILMVAITVAIAATVYVYVSGIIGPGTGSTPSISLSAAPDTTNTKCLITVGTVTQTGVDWADITGTLANLTSGTEITIRKHTWRPAGTVSGGDIMSLDNAFLGEVAAAGSDNIWDGFEYRFTLVYNTTGGTLGTITWTE